MGLDLIELGSPKIPRVGARRVRVYLPRGYVPDGDQAALFLFDGQNVFDDEGSYAGGWFAHQAVDGLSPRRHQLPVLVAVDHGGLKRSDDLAAWRDESTGGKAEALVNWMADSLAPRVQREFGVRAGPRGVAVCGSSMGGLAALYAHYLRPDVFGGALAFSSAFFWARGAIFRFVEKRDIPRGSRVYLDCGAKEGRMMVETRRMAELLTHKGYGPHNLLFREDPRGVHNEQHWRRRLPGALRFVFRRGD